MPIQAFRRMQSANDGGCLLYRILVHREQQRIRFYDADRLAALSRAPNTSGKKRKAPKKVKTQFMEEIYHTSNTISIFTIIFTYYFVVNQTMQTCGCTRYCTHCRGLKRKNKLYPLCMHHGVVRHRFPDAHRSFHVP